jgi:dihydroflavonol-4-reductase
MRVLVTGATGFIGANLVRLLIDRGIEVRVVRRASSPNLALEGLRLEAVTGALTDPEAMAAAVRGCRQVYHLAGAYETGPGAAARMLECHDAGTRVLGEAALRAGVERMVVCSSSITLPFGPKEAPAKEDDPDPFARTGVPYRGEILAYYQAKQAQERVAAALLERGLEVVLVHPDFVIGAWDVKPSSGRIVVQVAKAPWIPFYPPGGKSFIGARDCALGHILAMERGRPGARYLLGDHNLTYREALSAIAAVVGRPRPVVPLPGTALEVMKAVEERVGARAPALSAIVAQLDSVFIGRYRDPARARLELGLPSTPFESSVEEAYRWFRDHRYV